MKKTRRSRQGGIELEIDGVVMRVARGADPQTYLADVLTRLVNGHPNSRIDDLLPWAYVA